MKIAEVLERYDYDLPLLDAMNDRGMSPDRRVLAGATVGVCLSTAYFAVSEMEEAFAQLADDEEKGRRHGEGYLAMEAILEEQRPFQMRLWHLLHECSLDQAVSDLRWLKMVVYQRAQMANAVRDAGVNDRYWTSAEGREGKSAAELMTKVTERR
ncbi:hypothetical protein [Sphingomonas solaris]|uniref:Uncharacterized protein n=1 Tax=Alterirhizorhabdus solaris TaxID=2529389 RepID=A0A558QWI0_9SPHN|nr:hypothetical protein [Sphingomonas solaris]TVV71449.1 hypothetical protein FOY91_16790 [Sphingomonas solaris]